MPEDLVQKLEDVITESRKLRETAVSAERARKRWTLVIQVATVALALALAGLLWMTFQIRGLAQDNRELSETINSCTTPGEECFEDAQARTQGVVQRILEGQIAAQECREAIDIRTCMEQKLEP